MKFTSKREFADDILRGNLYANTPLFFRNLEKDKGERGQGDKYELLQVIEGTDLKFINRETHCCNFTIPKAKTTFQYKSDDKISMVSFVGMTLRDMILDSDNEKETIFRFPFTKEEYETMENTFGKYCVIIGTTQLIEKIERYSKKNQIAYIFDRINYCSQNMNSRFQAFCNHSEQRFLFKNEDLWYQREYRLVFDTGIPDDHFIGIGSLKKCKNY